ncbi:MAG: DUF2779 domain-containing protein [Lachnospiraceae bacterium]
MTKTEYTRGFQCPKMLWLDKNMPEAAVKVEDPSRKRIWDATEKAARQYFGSCVEVSRYMTEEEMLRQTREFLEAGESKIANATFCYDGAFCTVDMFIIREDKIYIIDIHPSTKTKVRYYDTMAYEYYVLSNATGKEIEKLFYMHINGKYIREKELDLDKLFLLEDCTKEVIQRQKETKNKIKLLKNIKKQKKEVKKEIGEQCYLPVQCHYRQYCHQNIIEPSVFSIHGLHARERYELYYAGIISFSDVLREGVELLEGQKLQVETEVYNKEPTIKKDEIKKFLDTISYPLYFLDFETFQQAVPEYEGVRPYQPIPFQYSLHVLKKEGAKLEHYEFLAREGKDPRRAVAEHLCRHIPRNICILAYNMGFEKSVLKNLAQLYPDLREHLTNIQKNMRDLMLPFKDYSYYCKEMEGSHSMKAVLPALYPKQREYDYHTLDGVHNGEEAMNIFCELPKYSEKEKIKIREELLAYCNLDTLGMVKILEKLRECVE